MKVIIEMVIDKCGDCPYCLYGGTSWSEDVFICKKTENEVNTETIPTTCPFIEKTLDKLVK